MCMCVVYLTVGSRCQVLQSNCLKSCLSTDVGSDGAVFSASGECATLYVLTREWDTE